MSSWNTRAKRITSGISRAAPSRSGSRLKTTMRIERAVMTSRISIVLTAAAVCVAFSGELAAHHSTAAEFDKQKPITFTGTIKRVDWMNPHIYTHIEVKGADGKSIVYKVEGGPPNALFR